MVLDLSNFILDFSTYNFLSPRSIQLLLPIAYVSQNTKVQLTVALSINSSMMNRKLYQGCTKNHFYCKPFDILMVQIELIGY